jgi:hypothetical protein
LALLISAKQLLQATSFLRYSLYTTVFIQFCMVKKMADVSHFPGRSVGVDRRLEQAADHLLLALAGLELHVRRQDDLVAQRDEIFHGHPVEVIGAQLDPVALSGQ